MTLQVLIVDDEAPIRRLLQNWVEAEGATTLQARTSEEALEAFSASVTPAVALCDIRLPGKDGLWLAEQLRVEHPETAVVMTTGVNEFDSAVNSMQAGVIDYLVKPFTRERFTEALQRAFFAHQSRREPRLSDIERAALLHNLGRLALPDALLVAEPQGLSDADRNRVRAYPLHGQAILRNVPYLAAASELAVAAHERYDGRGFPHGIKGEQIPLGARIIGVANAYDELVSGIGHGPVPPAEAVDILCTTRAAEFDPLVLGALKMLAPGSAPTA